MQYMVGAADYMRDVVGDHYDPKTVLFVQVFSVFSVLLSIILRSVLRRKYLANAAAPWYIGLTL